MGLPGKTSQLLNEYTNERAKGNLTLSSANIAETEVVNGQHFVTSGFFLHSLAVKSIMIGFDFEGKVKRTEVNL